ncbi:hypothetical protein [Spongiibacter marinus]
MLIDNKASVSNWGLLTRNALHLLEVIFASNEAKEATFGGPK